MYFQRITPYVVPEPLRLTGPYVSSVEHIVALPPLDSHELAWAAGFFDGEGSPYLTRYGSPRRAAPNAEVNQLRREPLDRFRAAVGDLGSMRLRPDPKQRRPRPMWSWYVRNWRTTQAVLTLLWPYLGVVKREQASAVFVGYQAEVDRNPKLGRPNVSRLWTETTCPLGHTDISIHTCLGKPVRRCRVCRRQGTTLTYRET